MTNEAESDLVIWPEAVTKFDENISKLVPKKVVIGGFFRQENTKAYTSAINLKTGHHYDKRNLVPFGEFQPFGSLLKSINNFFNIPNSSLSRGSFYQTKADWSALICWELVFNETFTRRVRGTKYKEVEKIYQPVLHAYDFSHTRLPCGSHCRLEEVLSA